MTQETTYTLTVTETNNKAGKYHYQVKDAAGNIISERKSNRQYMACTISGNRYFGRLDLVQNYIKECQKYNCQPRPIAYLNK